MTVLPVPELISLVEAIGIITTLFVIFFFSRKQMRNLSVSIETKILNDLNEKIHEMGEMMLHRPELVKLLNKNHQSNQTPELVFAYYILFTYSYAFHMRRRKILNDNEWAGWLQWMKTSFNEGTIREYWEKSVEPEKWFDPAFKDFIDKEITKQNNSSMK